jgi:hypothetical protein
MPVRSAEVLLAGTTVPADADGQPAIDYMTNVVNACVLPDYCARITCDVATSDCKVAGTCMPADGTCTAETDVLDGTACDDGDRMTDNDVCTAGLCAGGKPPSQSAVACDLIFP